MVEQEIHQNEVTENSTDHKSDNDLIKTTDNHNGIKWYQSLKKFLKLLNTFLKLPRTYTGGC